MRNRDLSLQRFLKTILVLAVFGAAAVSLTFFLVSQTDELADDRLRLEGVAPPRRSRSGRVTRAGWAP